MNGCQESGRVSEPQQGRTAGSTKVPPEVSGQDFKSAKSAGSVLLFSPTQGLSCRCKKVGFHDDWGFAGKDSAGRESQRV